MSSAAKVCILEAVERKKEMKSGRKIFLKIKLITFRMRFSAEF